jgi:hypothetical protein
MRVERRNGAAVVALLRLPRLRLALCLPRVGLGSNSWGAASVGVVSVVGARSSVDRAAGVVVGGAGVSVGAVSVVFSSVFNYNFIIASFPVFVTVVAVVLPAVLVAAAVVVAGVVNVLVVLVVAGVCSTTRDDVGRTRSERRRSRSY